MLTKHNDPPISVLGIHRVSAGCWMIRVTPSCSHHASTGASSSFVPSVHVHQVRADRLWASPKEHACMGRLAAYGKVYRASRKNLFRCPPLGFGGT